MIAGSLSTNFKLILLVIIVTSSVLTQDTQDNGCQVPGHPQSGIYTVTGEADPNSAGWISLDVTIRCNPGYTVMGKPSVNCRTGIWSDELPVCTRTCRLNKHPSVDYFCLTDGGTRLCNEFELGGTVVKPACKRPDYYYNGFLPAMHCVDGVWDYLAVCSPECGTLPSEDETTIQPVQAPWHVAVYSKSTRFSPYQVCGGSIISNTVIISGWTETRDSFAQRRTVSDIKVPPTFNGKPANLVDNIALVYVSEPFEYNLYVKPVCVDFDLEFDVGHLQPGNLAKVPFWDRNSDSGSSTPIKTSFIPYIAPQECIFIAGSDSTLITPDKFCLGNSNGVKFCERNLGSGVVFPERDRGVTRYFLRGIVSSVVKDDFNCNATLIAVTHLLKQENFIKTFL
ncbi:hypothetical protein K1T71_014490 [Dendrolimus kikuchii]|uniref:Uncharacterized protein n=1 Tax=Dendrolimus kikuchii TaxID=765133 RepID=A0ACC1CEJ8_9NEOP|nr:hypothetical protein K1T71_014490 [Dendrolimus kikuchii]